jgi:predicted aspartyl protease
MKRLILRGHSTSDSGMGDFRVAIQIARAKGERVEPLRALVDTGSTFTWIPRDLLERLGVIPEEELLFELADGREQRYPVAWVQIRLEGRREQPTIVVFAPAGSEPILGVVTLEEYLLAVDPVHHRLIPVAGLAKYAA